MPTEKLFDYIFPLLLDNVYSRAFLLRDAALAALQTSRAV